MTLAGHKAIAGGRLTLAGGTILGVVASGVLAVGAVSGAGVGNATCASISGIGGGTDCTSTFGSISVGLGPNTQAHSAGLGAAALAVGSNDLGQGSQATSEGILSAAYAGGGAQALAFGNLNLAVGQGGSAVVQAGDPLRPAPDIGNIAVSIGPANSNVYAGGNQDQRGVGNLAVSIGARKRAGSLDLVQAVGTLNSALNFGGAKNVVRVIGVLNNGTQIGGSSNFISVGNDPFRGRVLRPGLNVGFSIFGSRNEVNSGLPAGGNGPLAISGALFKSDLHTPTPVNRAGLGININNRVKIPNNEP
jgi:hypothetical protein